MGKLIFIIGTTRSGKSRFAIKLAKRISDKVAFIATCVPEDDEMKKRVRLHRKNRPLLWKTIDGEINILKVLQNIKSDFEVVIIDCLTLFISSLLLKRLEEKVIKKKIEGIVKLISKVPYTTIIVSNEVGGGVVPENKLAREFRDLVGMANQIVAGSANEVYFMVSGIPWRINE